MEEYTRNDEKEINKERVKGREKEGEGERKN